MFQKCVHMITCLVRFADCGARFGPAFWVVAALASFCLNMKYLPPTLVISTKNFIPSRYVLRGVRGPGLRQNSIQSRHEFCTSGKFGKTLQQLIIPITFTFFDFFLCRQYIVLKKKKQICFVSSHINSRKWPKSHYLLRFVFYFIKCVPKVT